MVIDLLGEHEIELVGRRVDALRIDHPDLDAGKIAAVGEPLELCRAERRGDDPPRRDAGFGKRGRIRSAVPDGEPPAPDPVGDDRLDQPIHPALAPGVDAIGMPEHRRHLLPLAQHRLLLKRVQELLIGIHDEAP